ncbi:MAG: hypothetical protein HYW50_02080 [Candidatus Diapherotrites archaeon]|nr:hypothetical protein [Candidatus Diapherotrites archaeon]
MSLISYLVISNTISNPLIPSIIMGAIYSLSVYFFASVRFEKGIPDTCLNCKHHIVFLQNSWSHVSSAGDKCKVENCLCNMPVKKGWFD